MIENIRKYTGLLIVVFAVVIVSFVFLDANTMQASGGGTPVIKIDGRSYNDREYRRLGEAGHQLTSSLAQSGDFSIYSFLFALSGNPQSQSEAVENFFTNRIFIRAAKDEFGIHPGDDEIDSYIRGLRAFSTPDGAFSQENYNNFINRGLGRLGLSEGDVRELISDFLAHQKLVTILGPGLASGREVVAREIAIENQRIALNLARLDLDTFEEGLDPDEEEIKSYWETIQDAFKTEPRRAFTYFIAAPSFPEEPASLPAPAEDASDEEKEEHSTKQAEAAAKFAQDRRLAQLQLDEKVDNFLFDLESNEQRSFEDVATENEWELVTTELFTESEPPEELNVTLRASSTQGTAVKELFRIEETSDPFSKISPAIAVGEGEWLVARLNETEPSRNQTYAEARAEARAQLIAERATAALKKAAEEANEKIKEGLEAGKSFADAAKDAGIGNETVSLSEVTSTFQPDTTTQPSNLFQAAQYVDPGSVAEPIFESDRAFLLHVEKREVVRQDDMAMRVDGQVSSSKETNRYTAFDAWLAGRYEAARVESMIKH